MCGIEAVQNRCHGLHIGQTTTSSVGSEHWTLAVFAQLFKVTRLPLLLAQLLGDSFPEDAVQTVLSLSSGEAAAPVPAKVTRFGSKWDRNAQTAAFITCFVCYIYIYPWGRGFPEGGRGGVGCNNVHVTCVKGWGGVGWGVKTFM